MASFSAAPALLRGDSGLQPDVMTTFSNLPFTHVTTEASLNSSDSLYGPRGDMWAECTTWFHVMPGAYFQLGNLFLCLAFMAGGASKIAAMYTHILALLSFASFAVWGYLDVCSPDIVAWSAALVLVNLIQILIIARRSSKTRAIMDKDGMRRLHSSRFSPFDISPQLFVELVTCKGCEITHLGKGQNFAVEMKTQTTRISLLLSGRMAVYCNGKFLQYITEDSFIDSPEWDADRSEESQTTFKVTITADSPCTYISWKRKGLLALLSKRKRLAKILGCMIGTDVADKLYGLNDRCITERGFRYDIRLPCVMSLPEDVERRNRAAAAASHSAPGTPGLDPEGRRHRQKRLGKVAAAKYANILATKLRARVSMRKNQGQKPVVARREPLKEDD